MWLWLLLIGDDDGQWWDNHLLNLLRELNLGGSCACWSHFVTTLSLFANLPVCPSLSSYANSVSLVKCFCCCSSSLASVRPPSPLEQWKLIDNFGMVNQRLVGWLTAWLASYLSMQSHVHPLDQSFIPSEIQNQKSIERHSRLGHRRLLFHMRL